MNKSKSVKLYMTLYFSTVYIVLLATKLIDQETFKALMIISMGLYTGGNIGAKFFKPKDK